MSWSSWTSAWTTSHSRIVGRSVILGEAQLGNGKLEWDEVAEVSFDVLASRPTALVEHPARNGASTIHHPGPIDDLATRERVPCPPWEDEPYESLDGLVS